MQPWLLLDSGARDPAFNMALDEALLEFAPQHGAPVLRFYGWTQPAASFGYFQHIVEIEPATTLRPLVRRPTGGGLVPHDADWTYSVVIPPSHAWYELRATESYERMHLWIQGSFTRLGLATELAPCCRKEIAGQCFAGFEKSDVLRLGRKIAGAAQRRAKSGLLIQGSVQQQPREVTRARWQQAMLERAETACGARWSDLPVNDELGRMTEELRATKYSQDAHNRRR